MAENDLDGAYALKTPDDNRAYYRDWAMSYDTAFAKDHGYVFPAHIARCYAAEAGASDRPVLDVGAGTGLVAEAMRAAGAEAPIDALDLSPEMLETARAKGVYRALIVGDLTATLPIADDSYGALVASGCSPTAMWGRSACRSSSGSRDRGRSAASGSTRASSMPPGSAPPSPCWSPSAASRRSASTGSGSTKAPTTTTPPMSA